MEHPNAQQHRTISFIKSGIRIFGYCLLFGVGNIWSFIAAVVLIISEFIGIYEEMV